jgi:hypothetical protein
MSGTGPTAGRSLTAATYWGSAAPALCAIHCVAAPLLVVVFPVLELSEAAEHVLMPATAALAAAFLMWGVRAHGRWVVWLPAALGMALWVGGDHLLSHSAAGLAAHLLGGGMLAGGLLWNAVLRHRARCAECGCPANA